MGYKLIIASIVCISAFCQNAFSDDVKETLVPVKIQRAFIPVGFDDNDNIQIVIKGYLPDTCYKMGPTQYSVDAATKTITLKQMAYLRPGFCLQVIAPFEEVVDLGRAVRGEFTVVDAFQGNQLGSLPVTKATITPGPDDYVYAPVRDVMVEKVGDQKNLVISGFFESRCMELKEVKINYTKDVVVVLPITRITSDQMGLCMGREYFTKTVPLKGGLEGEQLIHVRIQNGKSVNRVVDFSDIE